MKGENRSHESVRVDANYYAGGSKSVKHWILNLSYMSLSSIKSSYMEE